MRSRLALTVAVAAAALAVLAPAGVATAAGPSRATAERYAQRTYVVDPALGRRHFGLAGPRVAVTAADGSTITAFGAVLDSADGTGQIALLFRGARFLGWASAFETLRLALGRDGRSITVSYGVFRGDDPFCCASGRKVVRYRWNGRRIVASGQPPLVYGHRGARLHLGG